MDKLKLLQRQVFHEENWMGWWPRYLERQGRLPHDWMVWAFRWQMQRWSEEHPEPARPLLP